MPGRWRLRLEIALMIPIIVAHGAADSNVPSMALAMTSSGRTTQEHRASNAGRLSRFFGGGGLNDHESGVVMAAMVLVVDDDAGVREWLAELLEKDHRVLLTANGREGAGVLLKEDRCPFSATGPCPG
jgi:hypothetical protein